MSLPQKITSLDSSPYGDSPPIVPTRAIPRINKLHILETVRINYQTSPASAPPDEVMPRIPYDESHSELLRKQNSSLDMALFLGHDDVNRIVSECAGLGRVCSRSTRVAGKVRP